MLRRLIENEDGQDVVEYTLLIAFIVVASAALIYNSHDSMAGIVNTTNTTLNSARSVANSGGA